jgi:hypothetical protein
VLLFLHERGLITAKAPHEHKLPSDERLAARNHGDIVGLPWTIDVHNQRTIELSTSQDEVARKAKDIGTDRYASIQKRKGHDIEQSYVTMPLGVFVSVLTSDAQGVG